MVLGVIHQLMQQRRGEHHPPIAWLLVGKRPGRPGDPFHMAEVVASVAPGASLPGRRHHRLPGLGGPRIVSDQDHHSRAFGLTDRRV